MSQKDFGAQFGFSRETIAKIERGEQRVYWDLIVPIAIFGNKSLDDLADRTDIGTDFQSGSVVKEPSAHYARPEVAKSLEELVTEPRERERQMLASKLEVLYVDLRAEVDRLKDELLALYRKIRS